MRASGNSDDCGNVGEIARRQALLRVGRIAACLLAVALIGGGLYRGYTTWRNRHLEAQALQFAAHGDLSSAVLTARQLLAIQRDNNIALHLMAELADQTRSAEAVEWRKAIAALRPDDINEQLALARTALRFNQFDLASRVLRNVATVAAQMPLYHELRGGVALAQGNTSEAEEHFAAAVAADAGNDQLGLNLAVVRLACRAPEKIEMGRSELRRLASSATVRAAALRVIAADALGRKDFAAAQEATAALLAEKAPTFSDHLLHLEATNCATESLTRAQNAAANSSDHAAQLITWLNRHEHAAEAFAWAKTLSANVRDAQPVPLAMAESLSCVRDWQALAHFVRGKNWKQVEALRLAVESHAVRHLNADPEAQAEAAALWRSALRAAQSNPAQLGTIAQLAEGWDYKAQAQDAWWTIANRTEHAREALRALTRIYTAAHDSRGLLRVAKRALELDPNDLVAANNAASLGLLLNGDPASHHLAAKLHEEHPDNAVFAATYAFSLHLQGKTADALRVIERLKDHQLRQPAFAAYYVVMLADSGNLAKAREFLALAERAPLLPEEKQLLANAAKKLAASS